MEQLSEVNSGLVVTEGEAIGLRNRAGGDVRMFSDIRIPELGTRPKIYPTSERVRETPNQLCTTELSVIMSQEKEDHVATCYWRHPDKLKNNM